MKHIIYLITLFGIVLLSTSNAQNGSQNNNSNYWVSFGFGKSYFGPTLYTGISYSFRENIISMRYLSSEEFRFSAGDHSFDNPTLKINEFGVLYGRSYRKESLVLSASAGIGFVSGTNRGNQLNYKEFEKIKISSVGLPFEANFRIDFFKYVGIGGAFFGNINSKKTFMGGLACIYIGILN